MSQTVPAPATPLEPDPVIEVYKADIDRTLLRDNLRLSPTERVMRLQQAVRTIRALQQARQQSPVPHG
jgi:hypothetical protein